MLHKTLTECRVTHLERMTTEDERAPLIDKFDVDMRNIIALVMGLLNPSPESGLHHIFMIPNHV